MPPEVDVVFEGQNIEENVNGRDGECDKKQRHIRIGKDSFHFVRVLH